MAGWSRMTGADLNLIVTCVTKLMLLVGCLVGGQPVRHRSGNVQQADALLR